MLSRTGLKVYPRLVVVLVLATLVACGEESHDDALVAALTERDGLNEAQAECVVNEMHVTFDADAIEVVASSGMSGLPRNTWQDYVWIFSACAIAPPPLDGT